MKKYIKRNNYLKKVEPFIDKELIKVLVGQRRVGKSYMLLQIQDKIKALHPSANLIFINKDLNEYDTIQNYQDLYDYVKSNSVENDANYVLIDEIQNISEFEKALRSFAAEGNYDVYCTGSNADLLSGELSTYLSGRYIEIPVFPLSYNEFLEFHKLDDNRESLDHFLKFGGLPYLRNLSLTEDVVFDYLKNVYQAILFKDVVARFNIRNITFLEKLVQFLANHTGTVFSARNIVNFLKSQKINLSVNTVLDYLKYLQTAFFISKVPKTDMIGKKIFEVGEKYYFTDLGLRNSIAGFSPFELNLIVENTVFNHLIQCGYQVKIGHLNGYEIDFVAEKENERVYLQVALRIESKKTMEREFGNLLALKDNYAKYVITLDEYTGRSYEGILHLPLRSFLREFE
jgi:predicted AAA+ superfamily ATPase